MGIQKLSIRSAVGGTILLLAGACSPTAPTPVPTPTVTPPPPPPPASVTFSGTVFEFSDSEAPRPVPNLRLRVLAASRFDGAVGGTPLPDVVTDATGRYTVTDSPSRMVFFQVAPSQQHRFLCDWFGVWGTESAELPVVSQSWSGTKPPGSMWHTGGPVYGVVSESINGVTTPVAGARVTLETGNQDPEATTAPNGFYMICSMVGTDQTRWVTASKSGYKDQRIDFLGGGTMVANFTLIPD